MLRGLFHQFLLWHKAVSILCRLAEEVEETGLVAHSGIGGDAQIAGNRIGGDEPDAIDIGSQLIRVA